MLPGLGVPALGASIEWLFLAVHQGHARRPPSEVEESQLGPRLKSGADPQAHLQAHLQPPVELWPPKSLARARALSSSRDGSSLWISQSTTDLPPLPGSVWSWWPAPSSGWPKASRCCIPVSSVSLLSLDFVLLTRRDLKDPFELVTSKSLLFLSACSWPFAKLGSSSRCSGCPAASGDGAQNGNQVSCLTIRTLSVSVPEVRDNTLTRIVGRYFGLELGPFTMRLREQHHRGTWPARVSGAWWWWCGREWPAEVHIVSAKVVRGPKLWLADWLDVHLSVLISNKKGHNC